MPQEQTRITVRLTTEQDAWLASQVRPFSSKSDAIRDLIDTARQGLTGRVDYAPTVSVRNPTTPVAVQAVQASTPDQPSLPKAAVKSSSSKREKFEPRDTDTRLENFRDEVIAFWKAKKGSKSEGAWKLLQTELIKIIDKYGEAVAREQLANGIQAGTWQSLTLSNYERFKPRANTPAEPQNNHPASRVFRADDLYGETNPDNPLTELF